MSVEITPPIKVLVVEQSAPLVVTERATETVVAVTEGSQTLVVEQATARVVAERTTETVVAIAEGGRGPAGPVGTGVPGPPGPTGPAGLSGAAAASYEHVQNAVSDTWTIVHNLGFRPNVTTFDSGGSVVEGDVSYLDLNTVIVRFTSAFAGGAYIS